MLMLSTCTIVLATALSASTAAAGNSVWLEAERFDHHGGWSLDPQFIDQMGSPYLLAVGMGTPVDDAVTRVAVPQAGRCRLWARTRDWMPEHHPGAFQILLDGQACEKTFGQSGLGGWRWEDGGVHELAGDVEIRLRDLSGYYGRCDCILLAGAPDFTPPDDPEALAELRQALGGVSPTIQEMPGHDVVVIGGGLAGCTAAVAAARNGAGTVLIQNRPVLGGNASSEILVPPVGAWPGVYRTKYPLDPRETGFVEEYRTAGNQRVVEGRLYSNRLLRFVQVDPNLDLYLNTHATGGEMLPGPGNRIAAVLAMDVRTGRRMRFPGKIFIDCTGDSAVGVAAGAEYRQGKEPKSMYDEPWAPDEPTTNTMGNGLKYFARHTGSPQPFEAPPWIFAFGECDDFGPGRHPVLPTNIEIGGQWILELGGLRDTYADAEEIRDDLLRLIYGLWDHLKNRCEKSKEQAADCTLAWVGYVAGKRENRRLTGDYVLTQNDIGQQTMFPDRVAFGAWSVDDHYSGGFFYDGSLGQHMDRSEHHYKGHPFSIPFRSLYSRNVDNLLMAGRNISASHLGMSDTRVMLTCAIMGHAVGTGGAMCVELDETPRQLCHRHVDRLQQQLLKDGATIFALEADDPRDLARQATATASSQRTHASGERMAAANVINGFARAEGEKDQEKTNAWGPEFDAAGPHWVELAWPEPVTFDVVHVTFQTADLAPEWFAVEVDDHGSWRRVAEVPENRHRRHVLGIERVTTGRLRVVLDSPAAICEIRVYDEPAAAVEVARRAHETMRLSDEGPWLPWGDDPRDGRPPRELAPEGIDPARLAGLVLDDSQAEIRGAWSHSTYSSPFVLAGYLQDGDEAKGAKTIRFRPRVEKPGRYEVRLAYPAFKNRATNTPVTIRTADGATTVRVNQQKKAPIDGLFLPLGTFQLDAEGTVIEITNAGTDGYVVVDAVQLVPVP
jgi:hypothetical protein